MAKDGVVDISEDLISDHRVAEVTEVESQKGNMHTLEQGSGTFLTGRAIKAKYF